MQKRTRLIGNPYYDIRLPSLRTEDVEFFNEEEFIEQMNLGIEWNGMPDSLYGVTTHSPLSVRKAVAKMAKYFKMEFQYDFLQYTATDEQESARAFLFTTLNLNSYTHVHRDPSEVIVVGGCCFRWREWTDADPGWAMQWIWMHPFFRNRGKLSEAWPFFCKRFGLFKVEGPLSRAMVRFLETHPHITQ